MIKSPEKTAEEMTLYQKARLVNGFSNFSTACINDADIRSLQLLDGGTGINFEQLFTDFCDALKSEGTNGQNISAQALADVIDYFYETDKPEGYDNELHSYINSELLKRTGDEYAPSCFPPGILLGATFSRDTVYEMGEALGKEAELFGVDILLGTPNINIHRDPRNGRLFEGYSEDPCLVASLAPQLVKGVQKSAVAANIKHFAANNQETNRVGINEVISRRALMEIYLPGFEACVREGKAKTVMSAYNRINCVPCTENHWLLTELLRDSWGFEGMVVSDWGAVYDPVNALEAGNDLAMPGPLDPQPVIDAVNEGRLSEAVLDKAVIRILKLIDSLNTRKQPVHTAGLSLLTAKAAYKAATEGIVLLKNENKMFPVCPDTGRKIAVFGSGREKILDCGSGSAGITTNRTSDLPDCLRAQLGAENVLTADMQSFSDSSVLEKWIAENSVSDIIVSAVVSGMEGNDREDLYLSEKDDKLLKDLSHIKKKNGFMLGLILNTCGPVDTSDYEATLDGIFCMFLPGMEGGHAMADIMTGKVCPSGKLPLTFPVHCEDTPAFLNFPGDGYTVNYGEGIYVGYRYYDKKKIRPQYAFGHGLSYTEFEISHLDIKNDIFTDELSFTVDIRNTGSIKGAQVIQVYISDPVSTLPKPVKELKAFEKVWLEPGEKKTVSFTLGKKAFASFDMDHDKWIAEDGYYDILIADSSDENCIRESGRVYLESENEYSYGLNSTIKVLSEHPELAGALHKLCDNTGTEWQIIKTNYQYTPNKTLKNLFLEKNIPIQGSAVSDFIRDVKQVRKI
ncbi:MAG: glycoside hydrolase family 3 N-terminal domain-containing protein [Oscillospiraceae bacterium]|nr:glycoside hydrolase family 3 N-terminal domain-containing protein [Oscillospiraceae bacterium]